MIPALAYYIKRIDGKLSIDSIAYSKCSELIAAESTVGFVKWYEEGDVTFYFDEEALKANVNLGPQQIELVNT